MRQHYELTVGGRLGPGPQDDKEATVLNRVIRWTDAGLEYEADPRQAEKLIEELGLSTSSGTTPVKAVSTPCTKVTREMVANDVLLPQHRVSQFRGLAARAYYLAADRPDIQYAAKEVCRWMRCPAEHAMTALKRLVRYLIGKPRLVFRYPFQDASVVDCYSDTDSAGCPKTRLSTSGGVILLGQHIEDLLLHPADGVPLL